MGYSARALVQAVPGAAAVVDADGLVRAANADWLREMRPVDPAAVSDALRVTAGAGLTCVHTDGVDRLLRIAPMEADGGERHRLVGVVPVTDARCAACGSTLDRAAGAGAAPEAAGSDPATSAFLALLGHELLTPVSAVVGMADLLRALPLTQEVREVVDGVHRSTHLLKSMLNDLLDLARLETGGLDLDERPFALRALLEAVIEPMQQHARQKGLLLLAGAAPDVPAAVHADPDRIRQILTSLVGNGVKFTERGEVVVAATVDAGSLVLTVSDTGPGLTRRDRERVFAPFVQRDSSAARRHEGAGLGLAMAARLAARLGGRIDVTSVPGEGSQFRVRLPLVSADPGLVAVPDAVLPRVTARVAVAAPSPRSAEVLGWMLASAGIQVVPVTLAEVMSRPPAADVLVWCDDSHDDGASRRAAAIVGALGPSRRAVMISTTDPRRGVVRGPALLTSPLTRRRLVAVVNQERTGVRGAPVVVPRLPGGRVLLAEDNQVNRGVFERMIALIGVECEAVADGAEAVEAVLHGGPYDVVLMDMQMPVMDGLEATRRIRAANVGIPILALSATALRGDQERCIAAGMNGYLSKPITLNELREGLAVYLGPPSVLSASDLSVPDPSVSDLSVADPSVPDLSPRDVTGAGPGASGSVAAVARPAGVPPAVAVELGRLRDLEEQLADRPLVVSTVTAYLGELGSRRHALSDALGRDDRDALRAAAHTLKSSSALLGALPLAEACARVEERATDAAPAELRRLVAAVDEGAAGAAVVLAEYVA